MPCREIAFSQSCLEGRHILLAEGSMGVFTTSLAGWSYQTNFCTTIQLGDCEKDHGFITHINAS